jgi:hypothetical protein
MRISCLGWGSLIWKPEDLPVGKWLSDGPHIPIEFARQSADGRMTLVIAEDGGPVRVLWAPLDVKTIDEARKALAHREGCQLNAIGYWSPLVKPNSKSSATIASWALTKGLDGVVWTALKPKFGDEYRMPSAGEVIGYLTGLSGIPMEKAKEYVRRAPVQIKTPYRARIEDELGWLAEAGQT